MLLLGLLLGVQFPPFEPRPITPKEAAERVAKCNVGPVTIRIDQRYGEESEILVVAGADGADDATLACIEEASNFYDVDLPQAVQERFVKIREARAASIMRVSAREWLADHGLLQQLPEYKAGVTNDAAFAQRIEKVCRAKGALQSSFGIHAINPDWLRRKPLQTSLEDKALSCLMSMAMAVDYQLGFIGNEAAQ